MDQVLPRTTQDAAMRFADFDPLLVPRPDLRAAISAAKLTPEPQCVPPLIAAATLPPEAAARVRAQALTLIRTLRAKPKPQGVEGLIHEYSLSSDEGVALMCLAEALLRIPDNATRDALIRDKIKRGDWLAHVSGDNSLFVNAATWGLAVTGRLLDPIDQRGLGQALAQLLARGGEPIIRRGVDLAMRLMGGAVRHRRDDRGGARQRPAHGRQGLYPFLRHAGRGGGHRGGRSALLSILRCGDPRHRDGSGRRRAVSRAGHLHQAVGAAPALRTGAGRADNGRAAAAASGARRSGQGLRHRPQHRRRGGRPA